MYSIAYLKEHSGLPGPRGNLELLYAFAGEAASSVAHGWPGVAAWTALVDECLSAIKTDTANSPEEFVGMCGVLARALCIAKAGSGAVAPAIDFLRPYASHASWRIREAVAMGIQEVPTGGLSDTIEALRPWVGGNAYELRAVVAGLCEPKLLKDAATNREVLALLDSITGTLDHDRKLSDGENSLRKALGYGWSVVVAACISAGATDTVTTPHTSATNPGDGKEAFEKLLSRRGKHIAWIVRENLKKNRLVKADPDWVERMREAHA
jgi:hypothetical protein